jgi:uncharacterized membrane protein YhaH (DUF805 family)
MKKILSLFFSYKGRIGRVQFLLTVATTTAAYIASAKVIDSFFGKNDGVAEVILSAVGVIIVFASFFSPWVRRCHDLGWSGLRVLLMFVPIANSILMIYMIFCKSDDADNEWGQKPSWISLD